MIRPSRRATVGLGLLLAASPGLAACGSSTNSDESGSTTIRMGYVPWIGYGGWFIAEDQGYFEENGITVEFTAFNTDADKNSALASGQIDVLNVASHGALQLLQNGIDLKIVLIEDISTTADAIIAGPDITSITELAGRSVAYEEITTSDILLNYALQANGMTIDDIERVPMAASDAGAAFIAGQVDAAVTYAPYISEALAQDESTNQLYTAGEAPGLISDVLVVRTEFLEKNPEAIQALVDSWGKGMAYYVDNTEDAQSIIADAVGTDVNSLRTAFDGVEFYDIPANVDQLSGQFSEEILPLVQEAAIGAGILEGDVDFASAIDLTFIEASDQ
ncbi:ABC transporter substrate-binding protein [Brachybacterium sp. AOP42-C2-15]|uniref:ABC transporter substrate-binding protein n=1 Tax=Brachybacterium sp. AOP42-C2-15 TaxID=3457670 RepID=UPI003FDAB8C0